MRVENFHLQLFDNFLNPMAYTTSFLVHTPINKMAKQNTNNVILRNGYDLSCSCIFTSLILGFCFAFFVYTINRLPTPILQNKTPLEKIFHHQPDYSFLHTFGCACYPFTHPLSKQRFQFHSLKQIFLGNNPYHKGYLCLTNSGKILISLHVIFNENDFPFSTDFFKPSSPISKPPDLPSQFLQVLLPLLPQASSSSLSHIHQTPVTPQLHPHAPVPPQPSKPTLTRSRAPLEPLPTLSHDNTVGTMALLNPPPPEPIKPTNTHLHYSNRIRMGLWTYSKLG